MIPRPVVRSVSGTWHVWCEDVHDRTLTSCYRVVKVAKTADHFVPKGTNLKLCCECDWKINGTQRIFG